MIVKPLNDLTFLDFQYLAGRQPDLGDNWIYRLTRTLICEVNDKIYPKFDIYEELPIWFLTFQEAETRIKETVSNPRIENDLSAYCFHITQNEAVYVYNE